MKLIHISLYPTSEQNNMNENMQKNPIRCNERANRVGKTANLLGVSTRYVRMVLNGDRKSEEVMSVFMELQERENVLLQEVKKLIPFN